ncbi:MAG: flagellar hook-basal body complex protein [Thalassovita sp.]
MQQKGVQMTLSSSLNAGVAGLAANANRLASISDNIANASTSGYRRVETQFHSMVLSSNSGGSYAAGGVSTTTQRLISERGTPLTTSNPTDLTVANRGFLPVMSTAELGVDSTSPDLLLATTGSFRANSDGYLVSEAGLALLGWPAAADGSIPPYARDSGAGLEPIKMNVNQLSGDPTTAIQMALNLPATSTEAGADGTVEPFAIEYYDNLGLSQSLNFTFTPTVPVAGSSNEWTMAITDTASSGAVIGEYTLTFDDDRTAGGTLENVATISGGAYDTATGAVIVNVAGGPMEISIGTYGDPSGMSQLSNSFAPMNVVKDGFPVGNMTSVEVDENGYVHAIYDTGVTRTIYQIPLIDMPNPNGLTALDAQTYATSPQSGTFFLWDAGDGPTGGIKAFALEESTTDVAAELTHMIQTQRSYTSNAKVIQTVDEMLQETANIIR